MSALKDLVRCPQCGGADVVYSCEPRCCFNHVCADCKAAFLINTEETGDFERQATIEAAEPESTEATTGCARCQSLRIAVLRADANEILLVCADCRAVLRLVIEGGAASGGQER